MDWKYFIVKILIFIGLVLLISVKGYYHSNSESGGITGGGNPVPSELIENVEDSPNKRRVKKGGVDDLKKDNSTTTTTTNSTNTNSTSNDTLKNDDEKSKNKKRYSSYYRFKYRNKDPHHTSRFRDDNSYQQPSYDYVRPYNPPRNHYFGRDRPQEQDQQRYNDNDNVEYEQSFELIRDYDDLDYVGDDRAEYEDLHGNLREERPERTHLNYKQPLKKDPVTKKIIKPFINMNDFYTTTIKPEFPALLNPFHFHIPFFPKSKAKAKPKSNSTTTSKNNGSSDISSSTVILNPRGIKKRLDFKDIPNTLEQLLEGKFGKSLSVDLEDGETERLKRSKRSAEDDENDADDDDDKPKKKPVDKKKKDTKKETKKDGKKGKKDKEKEKEKDDDGNGDEPPAEEAEEDQEVSPPVQERNPLVELGQLLTGQQTQTQAPDKDMEKEKAKEKTKKKDKKEGDKGKKKKSKGKSSTEKPSTLMMPTIGVNGSWPSTANGSLSSSNETWSTTTWPTTMAPGPPWTVGPWTTPGSKLTSVDKTEDAITLKLPIDDQTYYLITMVKMSKSGAKGKMSRRRRSLMEFQEGSLAYQEEDVKLILERMIDQLRTRCHPLDKKLMDKATKNVHTLLKSVDNWSEFSTKFETSLEIMMDKTPQCNTRKKDAKTSSNSAESGEMSLEDSSSGSDSNSNEVQGSGKFRKEIDSVVEIPLVDQNIELYALDEGGPLTRMKRIDEESSKKFSSSTTFPTPKKEIKRLSGPEIQILSALPKPPSPSQSRYGFNIRNNRNLDENDQFGGSSSIGQRLYEKLKEQYEPKKSLKSASSQAQSQSQSIDELVYQKASKILDLENQIIQDPPTTSTTKTVVKSKHQDANGYDSSIIHIIVDDCDQIKPIIMDAAAQIILKQMEDDILYPSRARGRFQNPQQVAQARMDNYLMNQIIGIFNHCSVNYQKALELDEETPYNRRISLNNRKINDNKNIFLVKENPKSKQSGMKVEFIQVQMELLENPEPSSTFL